MDMQSTTYVYWKADEDLKASGCIRKIVYIVIMDVKFWKKVIAIIQNILQSAV